MSMELHVLLSKSRLPDVRQWQAAIDALEFDVKLDPSLQVESDTGFLPAKFKGRDSGLSSVFRPRRTSPKHTRSSPASLPGATLLETFVGAVI